MSKQCWFHWFTPPQCPNPGIYGTPYFVGFDGKRVEFVERSRWCEQHKHASDILIEDKQNREEREAHDA